MSDGKIIIDTEIDTKGAEKGIQSLNKSAKKGFEDVNKAALALGAALIGIGSASLIAGIDFESAFAGVVKTVDATDEELEALRNSIRNMAKEMPTSASAIAGVAEAAGQLGIKTSNIESFTKTMVMLGDSTNMSAEEAATSLARLANITGMPQTEFDKLGSTVVALGNNLATTESEIVNMGLRLAGAGSQVGMTEAQIMSFAGALSSVGIEAEAGGSAFSKVMVDMQLATETGGDTLKNFADVAGMSASEFKKAFQEDASSAIIAFIQGLSNAEDRGISAIGILDEMGIKEVRLRDSLLRAAGASDVFTNAIELGNNAWDENIALQKEANQRYETTKSKLLILKNAFIDLGISIFDKFEEPIKNALSIAIDKVTEFSEKLTNGELDNAISGISTALTVLGTVILGMNIAMFLNDIVGLTNAFLIGGNALKNYETTTKLAAAAQNLLNLAMSLNPMAWVAIGVAALVAGLIVLWNTNEGFRNALITAWNAIKEAGVAVWDWLVNVVTVTIPEAFNSMMSFISGIPAWFSNLWDSILETFTQWGNNVSNFFTQTIPIWIENIFNWFNELPYKLGYALGSALRSIVDWGINTWNYLTTNVPIWINGISTWFSELPGKIWTWLSNTIQKVSQWGTQTYNNAKNYASNTINGIITYFSQLPGKIWTWLSNTIQKVSQWGSQMISKGVQAANSTVSNVIQAFTSLPGKVFNVGVNAAKKLWDGIKSMGSWLKNQVSGFVDGIIAGFTGGKGGKSGKSSGKSRTITAGTSSQNSESPINLSRSVDPTISNVVAKMRSTVSAETARTSSRLTSNKVQSSTSNLRGVISVITSKLVDIEDAIREIDPNVYLDGNELVNSTVDKFDKVNGSRLKFKERGLV